MELHLIRHGQTNWNKERRSQGQSDSRLTDLGEQQARALGERLKSIDFDHIYCSSSLRTRQTAEHAFAHTDTAMDYLDSLREIFLGPWEGRLYDELESEYPEAFFHFWNEPHNFDVAGAETFHDLQDRAMASLNGIVASTNHQRVAVVSHGALIKTVLAHIEKIPLADLWQPPLMHNCAHSVIEHLGDLQYQIHVYADQPFAAIRQSE